MPSNTKIVVLETFRPFLRILQIFNSNNIPVNRKRNFYQIAGIIGFLLLLLITLTTLSFDVWFCVEQHFRPDKVAQPVSLLLYSMQVLIIYAVLINHNRQISAIVDRINDLVNKRK